MWWGTRNKFESYPITIFFSESLIRHVNSSMPRSQHFILTRHFTWSPSHSPTCCKVCVHRRHVRHWINTHSWTNTWIDIKKHKCKGPTNTLCRPVHTHIHSSNYAARILFLYVFTKCYRWSLQLYEDTQNPAVTFSLRSSFPPQET